MQCMQDRRMCGNASLHHMHVFPAYMGCLHRHLAMFALTLCPQSLPSCHQAMHHAHARNLQHTSRLACSPRHRIIPCPHALTWDLHPLLPSRGLRSSMTCPRSSWGPNCPAAARFLRRPATARTRSGRGCARRCGWGVRHGLRARGHGALSMGCGVVWRSKMTF